MLGVRGGAGARSFNLYFFINFVDRNIRILKILIISDESPKEKIQHVVDDQDKNLRGYCRNYEMVKKLTFAKEMSYLEILER